MLKISMIESSTDSLRYSVEGKLIGPWVDELERLCDSALSQSKDVTLDLSGLSFSDPRGLALLRSLCLRQVNLTNYSPFTKQQLKEAIR